MTKYYGKNACSKLYYLLSSACSLAVPAAIKCQTIRYIVMERQDNRGGNCWSLWLGMKTFGSLQLEILDFVEIHFQFVLYMGMIADNGTKIYAICAAHD